LSQIASSNAQLEANKKLVLDFWHAVFEAENADAAVNFLAADYIQHNPDMPQGCQGFIDVFSAKWKHSKHGVTYQNPPVIVLAEGDLVQLVLRFSLPEPNDPSKTYNGYWFDLFRVRDGLIVEHWDAARKSGTQLKEEK
jgi:predicted SnoaL-like aldol condensation-catalyzing enzyme